MFLPTSPRPPSGMIRQTPKLCADRLEYAGALETGANLRELLLRRLHHGETVAADLVSEEVDRSFDRNRVGLDLQEVVRRRELDVHLARAGGVALAMTPDHLLDLLAPDVSGDGDHADTAELEEVERDRVVA